MSSVSLRSGIIALALAVAAPVGASTPDESQPSPAQLLSEQILLALPDACPTEQAIIASIESIAAGADITVIAEALRLTQGARTWCPEAQEAFNAAIGAADVVLAANASVTGQPADARSAAAEGFLALRAAPPGGAGGSAYGP